MKINIKFTETEQSDKLRDYAHQKIESFEKHIQGEELDAAICDVEFRRSTHHQNGDVCTAEVTLEVSGKIYRASKHEKTLEKAMDKVKDDILESLRSDKSKSRDKFKKGAATVKEWLRRG